MDPVPGVVIDDSDDDVAEIEILKEGRNRDMDRNISPKANVVPASSDEQSADEDDLLASVTVVKGAEVMVHHRGDCPIHPFRKTFKEKKVIEKNETCCEKCFCYICNIPAKECKNWLDLSVRHCNAYHTKDGLWRFVREKYKEKREKQKNLISLKRDLNTERKKKRKERENAPLNLADLEEKMKKIEEIRQKKEEERLKQREEERNRKIENEQTFTYRSNEAFDEYESALPPAVPSQDPLEETETQPDWSKLKSGKNQKIKMKINFGPLPEVQCSDDSEEDLPPVLDDPSSKLRKNKRLFDDPDPTEYAPLNPCTELATEYPDLPENTVCSIPGDQMKPAGSGISDSSLSHLQRFMESMRQTSSDMLRAEQSNYQIRGGAAPRRVHRGGYRNKGLDGIRFLRTFEGDRVPTGTPPVDRSGTRGGKFHTAVPFEYGKRGRFQPRGGPAGANLTRGGAGGAGSFRGTSIPRGHAMPGGSMSSKRQEYEQLIADVNQHRNQSRFESSRESAERESSPPRRPNVENDAFTRDIQREERRQNERGVHRSTTYPDSTRGRSDQHGDSPATSDRRHHGGNDRVNDRGRYDRNDRQHNSTGPRGNYDRHQSSTGPRGNFDRHQSSTGPRGNFDRHQNSSGPRGNFDRPQGSSGQRGNYDRPNGSSGPSGNSDRPRSDQPGTYRFSDNQQRGTFEHRPRGGRGHPSRGRNAPYRGHRDRFINNRGGRPDNHSAPPVPPPRERTADYAEPDMGEYMVCGESMFNRGMYGSTHQAGATHTFAFDD